MRCLISTIQNPYFNLAAEEYFLKNDNEEIFMLYTNEPCIVVGKHQNLLSEINLPYILKNNIKLARRISGGGTVYQDLDNLNFSFIHNCANLGQIDFRTFTFPVLEALRDLGINAEFSDRNDLLIDSKKISGNAMHIYKTRVLSHGTLLFNTDLQKLSAALQCNYLRYIDKSIKSVRSKVTNIVHHLQHQLSIQEFSKDMFHNIVAKSEHSYIQSLSKKEEEIIQQISVEKYGTWDWVYGYSPNYLFKNKVLLPEGSFDVELKIERGSIIDSSIKITPDTPLFCAQAISTLVNNKHDYAILYHLLGSVLEYNSPSKNYISELCHQLF